MTKVLLIPPFATVGTCPAGGLGELFKCRDARGVMFAAKFPKDASSSAQQMVVDESRRVERHQGDHVVKYYGLVYHQDGRRGYAMELMDGSLGDVVVRDGALAPSRALLFLRDAATGLASVHASAPSAYHGDVKLANVLHKGMTAKLADFGLARGGVGQTQMLGPHQGGTPGYFPPEGFTSPEGDVYSLGVTLWAMLAGREPPPGGPLVTLDLAPRLAALLDSMLKSDRSRRIRIEAVLAQLPALTAEAKVTDQAKSFPDWLQGIAMLGVVFAGIFIVGGIVSRIKRNV